MMGWHQSRANLVMTYKSNKFGGWVGKVGDGGHILNIRIEIHNRTQYPS